ncbi:MAG: family intrarane metalloprotease protein [Nocardioidaceae bacterium]|nr:family intrarane metalloprotease protein [Nocardioidaceae bacterium]
MTYRFHRLARSWSKYAWWKLPLVGVVGAVFFVVTQFWIVGVYVAAHAGEDFDSVIDRLGSDLTIPGDFAVSMLSIIAMIPALMLATFLLGAKPVGLLWSVAGRMRWRWLGQMVALAVVVDLVMFSLGFSLSALVSSDDLSAPEFSGGSTWVLIGLVLVLTPFQSTAEEYVFRGYLAQLVGGFLKHPAWAILLPVPLFVLGHVYDAWGLLDVAAFAVVAGILTWMTGGLEAAIAAHAVNNVLLFLLGSIKVIDINATSGSLWGVMQTAVTGAVFIALVARQVDKVGLVTTRSQPLAAPPYPRVDDVRATSPSVDHAPHEG